MNENYLYWDAQRKIKISVPKTDEGKACWYFVLEDIVAKRAAAYSSMKRDLKDCIEAIEYIILKKSTIEQIVHTSLIFSSIVKYARCFTQADGRGVSLNDSAVFKENRAELLEFHNETMKIRHSFLAHAGKSDSENGEIVAILNPSETDKKVLRTRFTGVSQKDDIANLENYKNLFTVVMQHIDEQLSKLKERVNEMVKNLDINEIYEKASKPDSSDLIPFPVNHVD